MTSPDQTNRPDPRDFIGFDRLLDPDDRLLRDTVRQWVADRIMPSIGDWFEQGILPKELSVELGSLGLLGMHLQGYGCPGATAVQYGLTCLELEAGDSGLRSMVSVQGSLAMFPIWKYGSEEQRKEWLPGMASGEVLGCFGLTEPDSGSDPGSMRTTARRDGSDWILNGTKTWISNGSIADLSIIWARDDQAVRGFIVPTGTPGFAARDIPRKLSLRASHTSELTLSDVRLPKEAVLPGVATLRGPLSCLTEARYGIVWGSLGAARSCYEAALDYAATREQFGRPIGAFQLTQRKLVEMMVAINRGLLLALHIGRMKDQGLADPGHVSLGKFDNVRMALEVARAARSVLGANGVTLDYPVIRHMNNLESVITYEGTNEIHTLILGQALTGQSAFQ
ncbi:MAG: acyl-CoA dehydrogenase family protein [bacterium]|nr:acyl-CoA dehydrogenase family protein [bacterium]MCY3579905.1 acyl-CoA dehydrogenase family protein [bacterium]MCY3651889.1 acyl-CoA dehydrogenase family protein [bacterium]MDE0642666.1 acyl-CoA dehydrogenase family protein [bacterium]